MNTRRICGLLGLLLAMGWMAAAARAQDISNRAAVETAASGYASDAASDAGANPATATVAPAAAADSPAAPASASSIAPELSSGLAGNPSPAAPADILHTGWGWNFVAAYDFLDSNLSEGSENGTCTLCLGRDLISGWHFGGSRMFTENFGVTVDYSGHNTHGCYPCEAEGRPDLDEDDQFFLGGITLVKPLTPRIRLFAEGLSGAMLAGARDLGPGHTPIPGKAIGHHFGPSLAVGGGAEVKWSRRWGVRIFQLDYIWGDFNMTTTGLPQGQWGPISDVRMSAGIIMHLGGAD